MTMSKMPVDLSAFKAYDIRGIYPDQINPSFMHALARAYATRFKPRKVVIGYDARLSSEELAEALAKGLQDSGVDVLDIGLCGSEMVYYATGHLQTDGGIMITASHNPKEYNGCKMVSAGARPVGVDSGLNDIKQLLADDGPYEDANRRGTYEKRTITPEFIAHVLNVLTRSIRPDLNVVVNSGNGAAGPVISDLATRLPCTIHPVFEEPDGNFPNGVPNPLLPERRKETAEAVTRTGSHLGVALDGDFDRCFFFDENGRFIEGYYIVGLLARQMLEKYPGAKIVYDPRLTWHTIETVRECGGVPVMSRTGHAFIKDIMRREDAVYGGEMSAHHYFKDFWYCDSGVLPFLLILELLSVTDKTMSQLVDEAFERYPVSGEINYKVQGDPGTLMEKIAGHYEKKGGSVSYPDGLSVEFDEWRFSLRMSNTEPLLRLNVESRGDRSLMEQKTEELAAWIRTS